MSNEQQFLNLFMRNHISFFASPPPQLEKDYFERYNCARMDWRALRMEIERHHLTKTMIEELEELFKAAENFTFSLMATDHQYRHKLFMLEEEWNEIRAIAAHIKL